jgi:UDP-N-acetylmuramoylalanine-D-glutamate ligase
MINSVHKQVGVVRPVGARRSFFTSCTARGSLLEAMTEAAKDAPAGDANLRSPAWPSFDQFRNCQQSGEIFCRLVKSTGRGMPGRNPNINDKNVTLWVAAEVTHKK